MQDKSNEFDLIVRSKLEDAQLKPSRRAWKSISAQLDTIADASSYTVIPASRHSSRGISWGWAYGAMALAAALALFLVLSPLKSEELMWKSTALSAQASEIHLLPIEQSRPLLAMDERLPKSEVEEEVIVPTKDTSTEVVNEEEASQSHKPLSFRDRYRTFETDPFADTESESKRELGRTSIYAKGLVGGNDSEYMSMRRVASMAPSTTETGIKELGASSYGIPITLGVGLRFYLLPRFSMATGVDVSLLSRSFTGQYNTASGSSEGGNVSHDMLYIGIPFNFYYDIFASERMKFYTYAGAEAEYCISNRYTLHTTPKITQSSVVRKPMFSVAAGLGVEFALSKTIGLYLDPGIRYYFPSDQPRSIRTDRTMVVNFDAGLRFNF